MLTVSANLCVCVERGEGISTVTYTSLLFAKWEFIFIFLNLEKNAARASQDYIIMSMFHFAHVTNDVQHLHAPALLCQISPSKRMHPARETLPLVMQAITVGN